METTPRQHGPEAVAFRAQGSRIMVDCAIDLMIVDMEVGVVE